MNSIVNFILWMSVLYSFIENFLFIECKECILRRPGACKVINITAPESSTKVYLNDFNSPQPDGFALKTTIEINLLANKFTYVDNLPNEKKRRVSYGLDNAALVRVAIEMNYDTIIIYLGEKYYRLAVLEYYNDDWELVEKKYNRYTPSLPSFPYHLHLEITKNGTFALYADTNTEPFLTYQLPNDNVQVANINIFAPDDQLDLIAFYDCSKANRCGDRHVDSLYACREWVGAEKQNMEITGFQKTYGENIFFDEYVVVDTEHTAKMRFFDWEQEYEILILFNVNSIEAKLLENLDSHTHFAITKTVRAKQMFQIPASPYAVRVLITNGTDNNYLNISDIRGNQLLSLKLCGLITILKELYLEGPKLYFDCLLPIINEDISKYHDYDYDYDTDENVMMSNETLTRNETMISNETMLTNEAMTDKRPRKSLETGFYSSGYHEIGYNFTKPLLYLRDYIIYDHKPFVLYEYTFGVSKEDWCEGNAKPKLFVAGKDKSSEHSVTDLTNLAILEELKKINSNAESSNKEILSNLEKLGVQFEKQINATIITNEAILSELQKLSGQNSDQMNLQIDRTTNNEGIYSVSENINVSLDVLTSQAAQNSSTTVNDNSANVTNFINKNENQ